MSCFNTHICMAWITSGCELQFTRMSLPSVYSIHAYTLSLISNHTPSHVFLIWDLYQLFNSAWLLTMSAELNVMALVSIVRHRHSVKHIFSEAAKRINATFFRKLSIHHISIFLHFWNETLWEWKFESPFLLQIASDLFQTSPEFLSQCWTKLLVWSFGILWIYFYVTLKFYHLRLLAMPYTCCLICIYVAYISLEIRFMSYVFDEH